MRITAMTGAASAALGAVVVAGAAPALAATTLTQGSAIDAPSGACSLTLVGDGVAYTAAHCGGGEWRIGSPVRASDGATVGTVAGLPGTSGVDLAKIALADDVDVVGDWSTRDAATVDPFETVFTHGSSVPLGHPNSLHHAATTGEDALCGASGGGAIALDSATTGEGDAGGAVYDAQQRVVGVLTGTALVTFDADGRAVPCEAGAESSIMVPAEAFASADGAEAAPVKKARPAPKHAMTPEESAAAATRPAPKHALTAEEPHAPIGVEAEDLPTAGEAPAGSDDLTEFSEEEQAEIARGLIAREATEEAKRPAVHTATAAPAEGVEYGTQVVVKTSTGGFDSVTVTAYDADGDVLAQDGLDLDGEYRAWLFVPADVPAGGSVVVTTTDAAGAATDTLVTLGGAPIR